MTASFHDSALGADGGPVATVPTDDTLAVTIGDKVAVHVKWETPAATVAVDTGASTPTFDTGNAKYNHADGGFSSQTFHWEATGTGNVTPRAVFSGNVDFATIRAISFTPAGGTVLNAGATAVGEGESTTPSSGSASATAAGAAFAGFGMFGSVSYAPGSGWTEPAEFNISAAAAAAYQLQTGAGSLTADGTIGSQDWIATLFIMDEAAAATLVQEGFWWGVDDGDEDSHTFATAAQDTDITIAANQSRLIRLLVDTTDDQPATAWTLRYQKNGSGGYVAVPVGATVPETPAQVVATAAANTANPTTGFTITVPTVEVDDLLEVTFISRDHTSGTAHPTVSDDQSGSPGWTQAGFSDNRQVHVFYRRATAGVSGSTITIGGCVGSSCGGLRVIRGVLASGNPFTDFVWEENASGNEAHAAFTPSNDNSFVTFIVANDTNDTLAVTVMAAATLGTFEPEDYTDLSTGGSDCNIFVSGRGQSGAAADTGAFSWAQTNAATISGTYAIRPKAATNNEVYVTTSANIAAGGEATTARLTAPSGKTTSDFTTGRRWDDENGTDTTVDVAADFYTELEWLVFIASSAVDGDFFDFRLYASTAALDTYSLTPRWTIGGGNDMSAAGSLTISGVADLDATGSMLAAGSIVINGAAILFGAGNLSAVGAVVINGLAELDATGNLLAVGSVVINGAAALNALGNVAAVGAIVINGLAGLTSPGDNDIEASGSLVINGAAALTALGNMAAAGTLWINGVADLVDGNAAAGNTDDWVIRARRRLRR